MSRYVWYDDSPRRSVDRTYFPEHPEEGIREHAGLVGEMRAYVPSGYACPDYSVLDREQTEYYLWWRTQAARGRIENSDEGYAWLYCRELVGSDGDPREVLSRIVAFTRTCTASLRLMPMVSDLAFEYAVSRRLPLTMVPRSDEFSYNGIMLTWDLTRYPIVRPADGGLVSVGLCKLWSRYTEIPFGTMQDIVVMSIAGIDEITRSTSGQGVIRSIGCEADPVAMFPLERFVGPTGTERVTLPEIDAERGPLPRLVEAIVRQALRFIADGGGRGPTVPRTFPKEYRRVVAAAVDAVLNDCEWDARVFRSGDGGFWEDDDLEVFEEEEEELPRVLPQPNVPMEQPRLTEREIMGFWSSELEEETPYIPSGRAKAGYAFMDGDQTSFYRYWRTMVRRGRFLDTDAGYLWLFCTEAVNIDDDPEEIQRELTGALFAYGESAPSFLRSAVRDHAVLHGFDVPPEAVGWDKRYSAFVKLSMDPIGEMDVDMAEQLSGYASEKYTSEARDLHGLAFTAAVRAVDSYLKVAKNRRIIDRAPRTVDSGYVMLYKEFWLPRTRRAKVEFRDVISSKRINDLMNWVFRVSIRTVNSRLGDPMPRMPQEMPDDLAKAVGDAVDALLDSMEDERQARRAARQAETIRIDRRAVEEATRDLEAVTGMMAVEEDEPEEVEEISEPTGWDGFRSMLDEAELSYLRDSLTERGAGTWSLEGTGRRPQAVEESINTKAMDAIGDAVVEDGRAFEDYADEIGRTVQ